MMGALTPTSRYTFLTASPFANSNGRGRTEGGRDQSDQSCDAIASKGEMSLWMTPERGF